MAVQFARQLRDIVDAASRDSRVQLRFALHMIGDILVETFESDLQSIAIDRRGAADAMAIARGAAEIVDACQMIESALFAAPSERCFEEIALPIGRGHDTLADFVDRYLSSLWTPAVYMIWQRDPERYLHVGSVQTQPPAERGALLGALHEGSIITVMTPSPASAVAAGDLEAALLAVLDSRKRLPVLNVRPEGVDDRVRGALGTAFLTAIGQLLCELAARFPAPVERYRGLIG
jgi:hypothetical protein